MKKFRVFAEKATSLLAAFKKLRETHPILALAGWSVSCALVGAGISEWSLPLRGQLVIDRASFSPSLAADGLWDNDHPSPKAMELALSFGPQAVDALKDPKLSAPQLTVLVKALSQEREIHEKCNAIAKRTDAFSKEYDYKAQNEWIGCFKESERRLGRMMCLLKAAGHPLSGEDPDVAFKDRELNCQALGR